MGGKKNYLPKPGNEIIWSILLLEQDHPLLLGDSPEKNSSSSLLVLTDVLGYPS